jgi:hypothetical protein
MIFLVINKLRLVLENRISTALWYVWVLTMTVPTASESTSAILLVSIELVRLLALSRIREVEKRKYFYQDCAKILSSLY